MPDRVAMGIRPSVGRNHRKVKGRFFQPSNALRSVSGDVPRPAATRNSGRAIRGRVRRGHFRRFADYNRAMVRKPFVLVCVLSAGVLLAGCGPTSGPAPSSAPAATSTGGPTESTPPSGSSTPLPTSPPPGAQEIPPLPIDTSTGPVAVSLPWTLTGIDPKLNRIYLSAEVRACNEPIKVRLQETDAAVTLTLVGAEPPAGAVCPYHVTVRPGYLQLPDALGTRSIEHAPVTSPSK